MSHTVTQRTGVISSELDAAPLPRALKQIYANRGVDRLDDITLPLSQLAPPSALKGAQAAAEMLADAIEFHASVVIVGDFDADGATSCALAVSLLKQMGLEEVTYLVPNRFEFGYGLTPEIVGIAAQYQPDVLVTVDNGIASIDGVMAAQMLGMSVIITDHHLPGDTLPEADIIVNPNQPGCTFPSKALAGVGVMFYVLTALRAELRQRGWFESMGIDIPNLADALDLVALGTVADVVPLDKNNRTLVAAGLARMRSGRARPGIEALFEVAGRDISQVSSTDLGFVAGPRLNAAGRLDDMSVGIECLLAESSASARTLATQLNDFNKERKEIERTMQTDAMALLEKGDLSVGNEDFALSLFREDWHQGVVGILASRVRERFHRPTIVFAQSGDGELKGSGRSIPGVHLRDALDRVATSTPGLITKFGGHAMAAGLSLSQDDLPRFREAFNRVVAQALKGSLPDQVTVTDGQLPQSDLTLALAEALESGGPWGQAFEAPSFEGVFTISDMRVVGEKHLKFRLITEAGLIDAIAFNAEVETWTRDTPKALRCVYRPCVNEYRGDRRLQLQIEALWPQASG
ncbi:single-stranded-DNA-specific exonuclease RecJ [Luminiphilus sp.]|jgi:single-stranded-DNA-specific exonuclease|nr:single-stranded-DNA-specific exonuclease RecJ [Luminiphilus sp.]MDB2667370.1 single-stranded-DNA-specific exonuclease RecJ [Luminiphilus sp.]MDB3918628.1 single-stranded-DNA-specific exonuclease RecJ [Luminiphilus sp.]